MNSALSAAIIEAYAAAKPSDIDLDTLEFSNPAAGTYYIVQNNEDLTMTLEDASSHVFKGCGFEFALPPSGANGLQELTLTIDNTSQEVGDFLALAKGSGLPVVVKYRPYLYNDLTTPQMNPPLVLNLTDIVATLFQVTGKATFADILNKKFPSELYRRSVFKSLANA